MAAELLVLGVDFSFAPVLDIDCGVSQIIGNRSFSEDCELACQLAATFSKGMRSAGMAATGKHFPGHGAVTLDSHLALPVDERDFIAHQHHIAACQTSKSGAFIEIANSRRTFHAEVITKHRTIKAQLFAQNLCYPYSRKPGRELVYSRVDYMGYWI
jgi:hypothetical protein